MEFKLGKGPWQAIFQGVFQEHEMEILQNPESVLLVIIFDTENGMKAGALLECFKVFSAEGEMEGFIDKAKTDSIVLIKHAQNKTHRFFLLSASPTYAKYEEEAIQKETDFLVDSVNNNARIVKGMSIASDIKLKELHACDSETQKAFFSQPLGLASLFAVKEPGKNTFSVEKVRIEEGPTAGTVLIGIGNDGKPIKEPLALLEKIVVEGGKEQDRTHIERVIAESALLARATVILFDQKKHFTGLSAPTSETKELQKFGIHFEPIGFPVKELSVPEEVRVDISLLNARIIAEAFGLGSGETENALEETLKNTSADSLEAIISAIEGKKNKQELPEYQTARVVRVLRLIDSIYPKLFNGKNNIAEISKEWAKGLGKAAIIDLSKKDDRTLLLIAHSIVKGMLEHFKEKGKSKSLRAMVFLPKSEMLFPATGENYTAKEITDALWQLREYGVGFLLETERGITVSQTARSMAEATISIINGRDAGVQLKGKRSYRAKIRPTLSKP